MPTGLHPDGNFACTAAGLQAHWTAVAGGPGKTIRDVLVPDLKVLFVGINPILYSEPSVTISLDREIVSGWLCTWPV